MLHTILHTSVNYIIPLDVCKYISSYSSQEISYLPYDIHKRIIEYLPHHVKTSLNRKYFLRYHKEITFSPYEGYIRNTIRSNSTFILEELLRSNFSKWKKKKKHLYKKVKCDSFLSLLNTRCIEFKSNACRELLNEFMTS